MSTGPQDASSHGVSRGHTNARMQTTHLGVLPVSIQGSGLLLQLLQDLLCPLGICFEQVVMCSPRIASVLLKQSEIVVP